MIKLKTMDKYKQLKMVEHDLWIFAVWNKNEIKTGERIQILF